MTTVADDRSAESGLEPGLRERKKLQTRHAIHEAALQLIDEQGLEATTIDQICSAADVSSRTFFNYFPSKAAAVLQLPDATISPEVRERFLAARGGLVLALCDVVGSSSEAGPERSMKMRSVRIGAGLVLTLSGRKPVQIRRKTSSPACSANEAPSAGVRERRALAMAVRRPSRG